MTVAVRTDLTAAEVREQAKAAAAPDQARRLLAIALVLEGASREDAARSTGMDRQTLRDWVHRFNMAGPAGLLDRKAAGRQRRLNQDQLTSWPTAWGAAPTTSAAASCAGAWSISAPWSSAASASATRSAAWASSFGRSASAGSRPGRSTQDPTLQAQAEFKKNCPS